MESCIQYTEMRYRRIWVLIIVSIDKVCKREQALILPVAYFFYRTEVVRLRSVARQYSAPLVFCAAFLIRIDRTSPSTDIGSPIAQCVTETYGARL